MGSDHEDVDVLADLQARGLVQDSTDPEGLAERLRGGPVTVYVGFDPTAESLHVGSLVGVLVLRRLADAGHRAIALAGGATGMIGDPSGKSEERNLLDEETLARNLAGLREQLERLAGAEMVDNATWTAPLTLLAFLRDVGKHVTVNSMLAKESVRSRMEGEEGISYTEFTYMLLQAHDFLHLHVEEGCDLQAGGSDQWGNITAGIDLIRRKTGDAVHGFTWPLLLRSDGRKFGKSEAGNVWLSAERTSPYRFFQYWMQVPDDDVERFLLQLTLLPVDQAKALAASHAAAPQLREGQRRLAREVTSLVHGPEASAAAEAASAVLFGAELDDLEPGTLATLEEEVPTTDVATIDGGVDLVDLLVESGLASSRKDARRTIDEGGAYVNNRRRSAEDATVTPEDLQEGRYVLLRKGKRSYALVRVG
jgi:tyrosyl-tRNA synthetase